VTLPSRSVCLYADGAQNPGQLERGIGRYVSEHARAIEALAPSLLHSVLLNPSLSLTANLNPFLGKGLLFSSPGTQAAEGRTGEPPRVYHIMSPFEAATPIDVMWPLWARNSRIATVVTLYDLIPLIFPDQYLRNPGMRAFYSARVELIRQVDGILALSQHTAEDAVKRLQVSPDRVHIIAAGTSERFAAMYPSPAAAWAHISHNLKAVRPGFLLYVGAADFRKNPSKLIAGFGRLPAALRAQHQLVIAGFLNPGQDELLRDEADFAGIRPDELVLTGHVSESDLSALYHACTLFVFPSLYEGFGLPIVEAMSCGAPVAASATTSLPEVLGDLEGTFEPHDVDSIASCLAGILGSPDVLDRLRARSQRRVAEYTWKRVAEHSIEAYESAVARTACRGSRRPRIALVTPWPPERSRIADYNRRLAAALGQLVDVDVIVGRPVDLYPEPQERGVRLMDAHDFEQLRDLHQHDRVLYCMGSSKLHRHVYELLSRRSGAVVLHDVRLAGFYRWYAGIERPDEAERALAERIQAMYGERLPLDMAENGALAFDRHAALGIFMTRELQGHAEQCFVHSRFAREVLELDGGAIDRNVQVSVLPFAMPPAADAPRVQAAANPLIVSLGQAHEAIGIATLIDAFALLAADMSRARLVIAGHAGDPAGSERWHSYASEHAPGANIELPAQVSADRYAELLRTADLAVELRVVSGGEAPEALADCLASGLPTIVTDYGWAGELPPGVVEKVPLSTAPHQLKDRIMELIGDRSKLAALSRGALEQARACSFGRVADAYLAALGLN
jgi:glycosyltransferase involved in cell wall biosynthesis